jgi:hypothetical protein
MSLFSSIRYHQDRLRFIGKKHSGILTSPIHVVRQYIFSIEWNDEYYLLVNEHDLHRALVHLPPATLEVYRLNEEILGLPVIHTKSKIEEVMKGVFRWTSKL